ncbi:MAG: tRNA (adenosine(37)-N6)-threonylcarbamoyltransferase complex dimerization subunit type 1 TsaB [Candidatus Melainabacteria bacterium]
MTPTRILYLDTTGHTLMLALSEGDTLIDEHRQTAASHRYHSAALIPLVHQMLGGHGLTADSLTGVAINRGPGSFTGIRTGVMTARILAQFLPLTTYAFTPFELLAWAVHQKAPHPQGRYTIALDALRGQAYVAALTVAQGIPVLKEAPVLKVLPPEAPAGKVVADDTLHSALSGCDVTTVQTLNCFTPAAMHALLRQDAARYTLPWEDLLPVYLQDPNITMKKNVLAPSGPVC